MAVHMSDGVESASPKGGGRRLELADPL